MRSTNPSAVGSEIHVHARVFRYPAAAPERRWYVDIDDLDDQRPDDPFWYGCFESHRAAIDAACDQLTALRDAGQGERLALARVSDLPVRPAVGRAA
jgi:hypothetical protein